MEPMSKNLRSVIDSYGFDYEVNGALCTVWSANGEITFRRLNSTHYRVYMFAREKWHVSKLIAWMEDNL